MLTACLYDIHGNLPALKAVLAEIDRIGCERIVIGGDVALGPMPRQTLELLEVHGDRVRFVLGNCDRDMAHVHDGMIEPNLPWQARLRWAAEQLTPAQLEWLDSLPMTLTLDIAGLGPALFCHATPRSIDEIITRLTPENRVAEVLDGVSAPLIVCGHTHVQYDRVVGAHRVVNSGSVGLPYEGRTGAFWTLLGPDVRHMHTPYDIEATAVEIGASGWPDAETFASKDLLEPQTAEHASRTFENIAVERSRY